MLLFIFLKEQKYINVYFELAIIKIISISLLVHVLIKVTYLHWHKIYLILSKYAWYGKVVLNHMIVINVKWMFKSVCRVENQKGPITLYDWTQLVTSLFVKSMVNSYCKYYKWIACSVRKLHTWNDILIHLTKALNKT